jgi:hypothetical protein
MPVDQRDLLIGHDVGPVDEVESLVVDLAPRNAEDHHRPLQRFQGRGVHLEFAVLVEVAAADHHTVTELIDLVNGLGRKSRFFLCLVFARCRQRNHVEPPLEGLADEMIEAQKDHIVADVEALGADRIKVDHGFTSL